MTNPPPPGFSLPPIQRDAYGVIRGFVYQVDRTIDAWIHLEDDTELLCEFGEDLDYVRRAIEDAPDDHLLEQVKYRQDGSFSLRSFEVHVAIGNFLAVTANNPGARVRFSFFTNAQAVPERGHTFAPYQSGIDAWNAVSFGRTDADEHELTVERLRAALTGQSAAVHHQHRKKRSMSF